MNTVIHPIANSFEIHFTANVAEKSISVTEYDTINDTKTQLATWSEGHWTYRNPMQYDKLDKLFRVTPKLVRALKQQMTYLRDPFNHKKDLMRTNNLGRYLAVKMHKTLKLFV